MSRWNAAPLLALVTVALLVAACASTTVIGEGRLSTPVDAATERGDRALPETERAAEAEIEDTATTTDESAAQSFDDDIVSLGSAELVAAWSEECTNGSDLACDVLFTMTERESDAELLAQTCGGRSDVEVRFCTADIEPFEDRLWFDATSPGLPDVVEDCQNGDLISCDFLYFRSEVGSTYEELGTSCGNRVAIAVPDCRSALAG